MLTNNMKQFARGESKHNKETLTIIRGDIFYVDLGNTKDSVQGGIRPCIAIANNICNKYSSTIQIIPITSNLNKKKLPTHIIIPKNNFNGLNTNSLILVEAVDLISTSQIIKRIGHVTDKIMEKVDEKIELQFNLVDKERIDSMVASIRGAKQIYNSISEDNIVARQGAKQLLRMHLFDLKNYCSKFKLNYTKFYNDENNNEEQLNNFIINTNLQRNIVRM